MKKLLSKVKIEYKIVLVSLLFGLILLTSLIHPIITVFILILILSN